MYGCVCLSVCVCTYISIYQHIWEYFVSKFMVGERLIFPISRQVRRVSRRDVKWFRHELGRHVKLLTLPILPTLRSFLKSWTLNVKFRHFFNPLIYKFYLYKHIIDTQFSNIRNTFFSISFIINFIFIKIIITSMNNGDLTFSWPSRFTFNTTIIKRNQQRLHHLTVPIPYIP